MSRYLVLLGQDRSVETEIPRDRDIGDEFEHDGGWSKFTAPSRDANAAG